AIKALGLQIDGSTLRCLETTTLPTNVGEEQSSDQRKAQQPVKLPAGLVQEYGAIFDPELDLTKGFVHRVKRDPQCNQLHQSLGVFCSHCEQSSRKNYAGWKK
ncbi:hypothetical protein MTO96_039334, partial [Rhipicephalus appendiculatus]